jgi:TRAP-type C4-dicarboxylate transport system substrate-binding protein
MGRHKETRKYIYMTTHIWDYLILTVGEIANHNFDNIIYTT